MANPARAYLTTQVETTSQGELLIMLYEAAIKFLKRAKEEIERKDYAKKGIYISKAMAIIHELVESLNKEKGGEITPNLLSLYQFCTSQLVRANIRLDTKRIDDVIRILDGIRSAYAQVVNKENGKVPAGTQAQAPAAPQAPTIPPGAMQKQPAQAAPRLVPPTGEQAAKPSEKKMPSEAPATKTAPSAEAAAKPAPEQKAEAEKPAKPKPQSPPAPPKLRSAFNAAKFRAANAYNNNT